MTSLKMLKLEECRKSYFGGNKDDDEYVVI